MPISPDRTSFQQHSPSFSIPHPRSPTSADATPQRTPRLNERNLEFTPNATPRSSSPVPFFIPRSLSLTSLSDSLVETSQILTPSISETAEQEVTENCIINNVYGTSAHSPEIEDLLDVETGSSSTSQSSPESPLSDSSDFEDDRIDPDATISAVDSEPAYPKNLIPHLVMLQNTAKKSNGSGAFAKRSVVSRSRAKIAMGQGGAVRKRR